MDFEAQLIEALSRAPMTVEDAKLAILRQCQILVRDTSLHIVDKTTQEDIDKRVMRVAVVERPMITLSIEVK